MALPLLSYSQNNNAVNGKDAEYAVSELDSQPEFPNGNDGLVKYLSENINYPKKALKKIPVIVRTDATATTLFSIGPCCSQ